MRREVEYFDEETIEAEIAALERSDAIKLLYLLELYRTCGIQATSPLYIEDYGEGLLLLRHTSGAYKGRCFFVTTIKRKDFQKCVVLLVYRKESQKADPQAVERARRRMETILKENR
ncbi:hypothetical protein BH11ARM2_BH11ARM2_31310 [soil metagenome]